MKEKIKKLYIDAARVFHESEGEIEFDDEPKISESCDAESKYNGAYVQAWIWISREDIGDAQ